MISISTPPESPCPRSKILFCEMNEIVPGMALVAFFLDARVWPDGDAAVFRTAVVPIKDGQAIAVFEDVPAGPFAVSVFHDENDNGELDSAALGIPSEPYGFSAEARDLFGPPSFKEARIDLAAGETKQITIRVK